MRWHLFAFLPLLMDDACAWHLKGQHVPRWAFHTENHAKSGQFMWIYWRWECCSAGGCSGHKVRGCWSTRPSCGRQGHEVRSALLLLGVSSCPAHGRAWAGRVLGSVIPPPSLPWAAVGRRRRWSVSLGKGQTWVGFLQGMWGASCVLLSWAPAWPQQLSWGEMRMALACCLHVQLFPQN